MAKVQSHHHHSWLLIIVIPLVIVALILVLVLSLISKNSPGWISQVVPLPTSSPSQEKNQPEVTPALSQSDAIADIEKDLGSTEIDNLQGELNQMETLLNQL